MVLITLNILLLITMIITSIILCHTSKKGVSNVSNYEDD